MIKNYFVTAWRNLTRNKLFSLINILGLSIGISASLVIYLIVHYDFSFDRFEKDGDRIFRVVSEYTYQGNTGHGRGVPAPLGELISKGVSGLEETAVLRYFKVRNLAIPGKDAAHPAIFKNQEDIVFTDGHYMNLLPYKWLTGSAATALAGPGRVVLTASRARLYFPSLSYSDVMGRSVVYADSIQTVVSGIVQDLDASGNTDFSFREFISLPTLLDNHGLRERANWDKWGAVTSDHQLYVRLGPGVQPRSVERQITDAFIDIHGKKDTKNLRKVSYLLQPLSDIHFNHQYGTFKPNLADKPALYALLLVAAFLLLLGCINFINLTTAQASQRAREIGVRKTLGGSKGQLFLQFLSETFLITFVATLLSLALVPLLLKAFAGFVPKDLHFSFGDLLYEPHLVVFLAGLVLFVSLFAGFYPALVLSSWKPVQVLKNQLFAGSGKTRTAWLRQTLTVAQFVIAQAFVMGTFLVGKQIRFLLDKDMGFRREAILSFSVPRVDTSHARRLYLMDAIGQLPGVALTSLGNDEPASGGTWSTQAEYRNGKRDVVTAVELKFGDSNYLRLFHIPLVAGREPLPVPSDSVREVLINETYLRILGFSEPRQALGKTLDYDGRNVSIAGVMRDFYPHGLKGEIPPMLFAAANKDCRDVIVALRPRGDEGSRSGSRTGAQDRGADGPTEGGEDWKSAIAGMEKAYKKLYPEDAFAYHFF